MAVMTTFRELHTAEAGFVMPNAWDAGSTVLLAEAGFPALATTSAGIAFSLGKGDHTLPDGAPAVSREQMFERIQEITEASGVPVNGDLEDGYGAQPEAVADTIRLAREAAWPAATSRTTTAAACTTKRCPWSASRQPVRRLAPTSS